MSKTKTMNRSAAAAASVQTWNITNDTDADIVVISVAGDSSGEQLYTRELNILQTADGASFIKAASGAVMRFEEATTNSLIIAKADNLFPLKTVDAPAQGANTYGEVAVTAGDLKNMQLTEKFVQMIRTFTTSALAKDFTDALATKDPDIIDGFFKNNKDYSNLTQDMVAAVQTYYEAYPFIWADYKEAKTYQLYTSDGKKNKYIGSVSLRNECAVPMSTDKTVPGFSMIYQSAETDAEPAPLYYSKGQFVDDLDNPTVCLQAFFILKSQVTHKDDDKSIITMVSGTADGDTVLGYEDKANEQKKKSLIAGLIDPHTTQDWLTLVGGALLAAAALGILVKVAKTAFDALKDALNKKAMMERMKGEWNQKARELRNRYQAEFNRLKARGSVLPEDTSMYWKSITDFQISQLTAQQSNNLREIRDAQIEYTEKLLKYGNNKELGEIYTKLRDTYGTDWTSISRDGKQVQDWVKEFKSNSEKLASRQASIGKEEMKDQWDVAERSKKAIKDTIEITESNEMMKDLWREEGIPEFEEIVE